LHLGKTALKRIDIPTDWDMQYFAPTLMIGALLPFHYMQLLRQGRGVAGNSNGFSVDCLDGGAVAQAPMALVSPPRPR
jgi:hypothetical protein